MHQRHCGHYCHQSIYLIDTATETKDTIGTSDTIVTKSTSEMQLPTPMTPEALQALLSPKHLTETATDTKETRGTNDTKHTWFLHEIVLIEHIS